MNELDRNRKLILKEVIAEVDALENLTAYWRIELVGKIMNILSADKHLKFLKKELDEILNEARIQNEINFVQSN
jgi:hypothetical protein